MTLETTASVAAILSDDPAARIPLRLLMRREARARLRRKRCRRHE
jgi:hypothetical protein